MTDNELILRSTTEAHVERLKLGEPTAEHAGPVPPQLPNRVPTRTAEQTLALPAVIDMARRRTRTEGFRGAVVLASRDHNRITVYSQYDAGARPPAPVAGAVEEAGIPVRTLDRRTYDLVWRAGHEDPTIVSLRRSPLVHFGLFTVLDNQADALLAKIEASAPASLVTPGLRTINFHRSHDAQRMINFGTWSTFDEMHVLLDQPGFTPGEKYHHGLAVFENDYFDVIDVVTGSDA
ncbi:hypothetical protein JIG36_27755 [Actinoplanes sp. LDG1-06]|uniref:Antibiotic biosynthesis monooxygenase n=1 Tax=Paractinoplanes ovalisporus TaxID=2810368 RepID=A0ABS2AHR8_9ACTN|nr:hypothetical protein [Actinoplanes ovalisporus]MBM2619353.1 hypothetical protein [Actinoplanes ovalisporus]